MKRLVFNSLVLVACLAALLRLLYAIAGPNATETTFVNRYDTTIFFPEGWGFFTKSPREEKHTAYYVLPNGQLSPVHSKNGSAQNWFGLSRRSRRVNMELSQLFAAAQADSGWVQVVDHEADFTGLRFNRLAVDTIRFDGKKYHLLRRGDYILKRYRIPAWSWARYPAHFTPRAALKKIILR